MSSRLLFAYGILGSAPLSRLLCYASRYLRTETLVLLGDMVSPSIVKWLFELCGLRVLGVLGRYDSAATATALSDVNGLIECKMINVGRITLYGVGLSGCTDLPASSTVDILISNLPGLRNGCCDPRSDLVDRIADVLKPRLIVTGLCRRPCKAGSVFSPGSIGLGYIGLFDLADNKDLNMQAMNLHTILLHTDHWPT